jgi:putative transposase
LKPRELSEAVSADHDVPIKRQCELLGLNRATYYYKPKAMSMAQAAYLERVMARIDYWHTVQPAVGSRQLARIIKGQDDLPVGRKLIVKLMRKMGITAFYPKPNLSVPNNKHKKYPYLLRGLAITMANHVWAIDITYIKMGRTHMYLTAIIDWYSRFIVGWRLSDTLETAPVLECVKAAIERHGCPGIINSDQGSQFTSVEYTALLAERGIRQSMDGKARWVDNVIIERWFRSLKCENIYIVDYPSPRELRKGIREYVDFYNNIRPHEGVERQTPLQAYQDTFRAA